MRYLPTDKADIGNKPFTNISVDYFGSTSMKLTKQSRSNNAKVKYWESYTHVSTNVLFI